MKTHRLLLFFAIVATLLIACSKSEEASTDVSFSGSTPSPPAQTTAPALETAGTTSSAASEALVARSSTGEVVSISLTGTPRIEVASSSLNVTLSGESKDTGKHKYYDGSGVQRLEVKPSDSGFKVRTPDGSLLWKVKVSDDKIKVSDNEENRDAWSIKTGYPDKAKVVDPSEAEAGEIRFANAPAPARVRDRSGADAWTIEGANGSGAWGVLLLDSVPLDQRAVIVAELLSRGR